MKYLKLLPIIFFLVSLLNSCGYKNLNSEKLNNFKINNLEINGERKATYKLKNNIKIYSSDNSKFIYDIVIDLISTKETKIKDATGKTSRYSSKFLANILITEINTKKIFKKTFDSSNDYDVGNTNSDTLNNEKNAVENNINYISNEVIKYLRLLNI